MRRLHEKKAPQAGPRTFGVGAEYRALCSIPDFVMRITGKNRPVFRRGEAVESAMNPMVNYFAATATAAKPFCSTSRTNAPYLARRRSLEVRYSG